MQRLTCCYMDASAFKSYWARMVTRLRLDWEFKKYCAAFKVWLSEAAKSNLKQGLCYCSESRWHGEEEEETLKLKIDRPALIHCFFHENFFFWHVRLQTPQELFIRAESVTFRSRDLALCGRKYLESNRNFLIFKNRSSSWVHVCGHETFVPLQIRSQSDAWLR